MGACGCQKCVQVESEQHEEGLFGYAELIQQLVAGRSTIEDIEAFLFNKISKHLPHHGRFPNFSRAPPEFGQGFSTCCAIQKKIAIHTQ